MMSRPNLQRPDDRCCPFATERYVANQADEYEKCLTTGQMSSPPISPTASREGIFALNGLMSD